MSEAVGVSSAVHGKPRSGCSLLLHRGQGCAVVQLYRSYALSKTRRTLPSCVRPIVNEPMDFTGVWAEDPGSGSTCGWTVLEILTGLGGWDFLFPPCTMDTQNGCSPELVRINGKCVQLPSRHSCIPIWLTLDYVTPLGEWRVLSSERQCPRLSWLPSLLCLEWPSTVTHLY